MAKNFCFKLSPHNSDCVILSEAETCNTDLQANTFQLSTKTKVILKCKGLDINGQSCFKIMNKFQSQSGQTSMEICSCD